MEATIFDLSLQTAARFRPFELVATGFAAEAVASALLAPFAAVEVRLGPDTGEASAGLVAEDGDHVLVRWSAVSSQVRPRCVATGAPTSCTTGRCLRRLDRDLPSRSARTR